MTIIIVIVFLYDKVYIITEELKSVKDLFLKTLSKLISFGLGISAIVGTEPEVISNLIEIIG